MPVLVEAISVIIRREAVRNRYAGGGIAFMAEVPNRTMCWDRDFFRVGFMCPEDTETYVLLLAARGLIYLREGTARDVVVADQQSGLCAPCRWAECYRMDIGDPRIGTVTICQAVGSTDDVVSCPKGWRFEGSLSDRFGFAPLGIEDEFVDGMGHMDGLDVFHVLENGRIGYTGRPFGPTSVRKHKKPPPDEQPPDPLA